MCIENKACCNLEGMDAGAVLHDISFRRWGSCNVLLGSCSVCGIWALDVRERHMSSLRMSSVRSS